MKSGIRVPQPYLILWDSGVALSCNLEGAVLAEELHGLFAARLAMAELLAVQGEQAKAERLRQAAHTLRDIVEERYWTEEDGFYALRPDREEAYRATGNHGPGCHLGRLGRWQLPRN